MTALAATDRALARAVRWVRDSLDNVEAALRPDADRENPTDPTTQEILLPRETGEPASNRARRQAEVYLEHRRRRLRDDLEGR